MTNGEKGAPEGINDREWHSKPKKKVVKPPKVTILGHRINHARVEEGRSPMDEEGDKMVDKDSNITF